MQNTWDQARFDRLFGWRVHIEHYVITRQSPQVKKITSHWKLGADITSQLRANCRAGPSWECHHQDANWIRQNVCCERDHQMTLFSMYKHKGSLPCSSCRFGRATSKSARNLVWIHYETSRMPSVRLFVCLVVVNHVQSKSLYKGSHW